jgi:hypothetical protein
MLAVALSATIASAAIGECIRSAVSHEMAGRIVPDLDVLQPTPETRCAGDSRRAQLLQSDVGGGVARGAEGEGRRAGAGCRCELTAMVPRSTTTSAGEMERVVTAER